MRLSSLPRRCLVVVVLCLIGGQANGVWGAEGSAGLRPNIVLMLADDLGYGDVRRLNPEGKIATPNLDRLAAAGMAFTDAHSSSAVCTPTRYSILTGRYNWRSPLKRAVLEGYSPRLIEPGRLTLPALLQRHGYDTAGIGKWHLGMDWPLTNAGIAKTYADGWKVDYSKPIQNGPNSVGFDYFFGIAASLDMPPFIFIENDRCLGVPTVEKTWIRKGPAHQDFEAVEVLPTLTAKAVRYIDEHASRAKAGHPFFLYLPLNSPHTPILPTREWQGKSGLNAYGDFVMQTDHAAGQVLAALERQGLADNTLVIFTSDNGCSPAAKIEELQAKGHYPSFQYRGYKADIFDGGHRIPFLVRWPGKVKAGAISDQLVCLVDLMATCADVLGVPLADNAGEDSVSLLPALLGNAKKALREAVVHHSINGSFAIRQGSWKLELCPDSGGWSSPKPGSPAARELPPIQLYDLAKDPGEKTNVHARHPEVVQHLTRLLEKYVADGRSTPGTPQINTGEVDIGRKRPQPQPAMTNRQEALTVPAREMVLEKRYLNLPVKNRAPKRRLRLSIDDQTVREFEIELADTQPDFWVFLDISCFQGRQAVLSLDKNARNAGLLASIEQGDTIKGADDLYREKLRPQFHFSSRRGWNNDPNGLVFFQGEYHLFYQHNPFGWDWGNMHWGHAVSSDLMHWVEQPLALYPRRFDDWAFSGSAVVDWHNTSGLKTGKENVIVAAFTSTGRGECMIYSNDRGRSWTEFSGNPVVKHQGRDPKVIWYEPTKQWIMALYDESEGKRWIAFYSSPDLKTWQFQSRIEGFYECPDLFELPVDANPSQRKWVLTAASSEYMIGSFDGKQFIPETPKLAGHRGNAFYAAQTYSDIPAADGRRIQIGWGQMPSPNMPFNQMMTFPCELTLRTTPEGPRLHWQPAKEIEKLRVGEHRWQSLELKPGDNPLSAITGELFDLRSEFDPGDATAVGFNLRGVPVVYDVAKQELSCQDRRARLARVAGKVRLQILMDRTSFEIFGNDGLVYLPMKVIAPAENKSMEVFARSGSARVSRLEVYELGSVWSMTGQN